MAVVKFETVGSDEVLRIEVNSPDIGLSTLLSFLGENDSGKEYQISKDGDNWSGWKALTSTSLKSEDIVSFSNIYLRYKNGNSVSEPDYFSESIFSKYFSSHSIDILKWYLNIVEKIRSGELNKYIKFDDGSGDSTDAILFWETIAKFYGFYITLARVYKDFYLNDELLNKYLVSRGLFTSESNTLEELNFLMENHSGEMFKRGTTNILNKKDGDIPVGELIRYLDLEEDSEFLFNYFLPQHCGWWVDSASPLYRGLEDHLNANRLILENYTTDGTINEVDPNDIRISFDSGSFEYDEVEENLININPRQSYIIEFLVKVEEGKITIGVDCFDENNNLIADGTLNMSTLDEDNLFIEDLDLDRFSEFPDTYFPIKCIIYGQDKPKFTDDSLNIGVGNNLKFSESEGVVKIYPNIKVDGKIEIKDLYLRPLYTEYERGFIHMNHFIQLDYSKPNEENNLTSILVDNLGEAINTNDEENILVNV